MKLSSRSSYPVDITYIDDDWEYPITYVIVGAWFEPGSLPTQDEPGEAPYYDFKYAYVQGDPAQTDVSEKIMKEALAQVEKFFVDSDLYV